MEKGIKNVQIIGVVKDKINSNHDIVVEFTNLEKYVATFFTVANIQYLMLHYELNTGECNNGSFFWSSDMIIVKYMDEGLILESIKTIIKQEIFHDIFKKIS